MASSLTEWYIITNHNEMSSVSENTTDQLSVLEILALNEAHLNALKSANKLCVNKNELYSHYYSQCQEVLEYFCQTLEMLKTTQDSKLKKLFFFEEIKCFLFCT